MSYQNQTPGEPPLVGEMQWFTDYFDHTTVHDCSPGNFLHSARPCSLIRKMKMVPLPFVSHMSNGYSLSLTLL